MPYEPGVKVGHGWDVYDQIVGLDDANGDGFGDVVARTPGGDLYFYAGTGDLAKPFKAREQVGYGYDVYNQLVAVGDTDGDGHADFMARKENGDTYSYRSTRAGTFAPRVFDKAGWEEAALFAGAGGNPDYGKHELLAITNAGLFWWYQFKNNGELAKHSTHSPDGEPSGAHIRTTLYAGSFSNDGEPAQVHVYQGQLWVGGNFIGRGWDAYDNLTAPGDLSGDGKADLLARDAKGDLYLYEGNGLGTAFAPRAKVGYGYDTYTKIVGGGDLSGDGIADVVAVAKDGTLYLYEGTGTASVPLKARKVIGTGFDIYNKFAAPGDLNGDGKADLIGVNGYGDLYRYTSTGTGSISPRVQIGDNWNIYKAIS
ncbi:Repeat domain-containing protein [Streptomyces sp. 2131.1]|uniref:FG-GAP repeat domain-containing protein n=1 Tax=Streptomyces sp. 2131.1 TaxID=1855346 RepID=UPI00089436AD|nr:VCBS repeat-containing protein [Streptomyces sp. 2131.1]SEE46064.1 Repeat domain-containing protein [Streptomyces sp. 2131.1]